MGRMRRCELCGKISWRGRAVITASDGINPKKIVINGREYTKVKLCKKCTDAILKMVIDIEGEKAIEGRP